MAWEIMELEKKYEMNFYIHSSIAELQDYLYSFKLSKISDLFILLYLVYASKEMSLGFRP